MYSTMFLKQLTISRHQRILSAASTCSAYARRSVARHANDKRATAGLCASHLPLQAGERRLGRGRRALFNGSPPRLNDTLAKASAWRTPARHLCARRHMYQPNAWHRCRRGRDQ